MQEEIEQKSVTLMINGTKFSLRTLKSAAVKASESRALKNTRTRGLSPSTLRIA